MTSKAKTISKSDVFNTDFNDIENKILKQIKINDYIISILEQQLLFNDNIKTKLNQQKYIISSYIFIIISIIMIISYLIFNIFCFFI